MRLKRRGRNIEHRHSSLARGWPNRESEMAAEAPIYTLGALLRSSAASHADSPALILPDRKVSYRKLNESARAWARTFIALRSEEHTSELQSLMRISYAVFCMKKNTTSQA